MVNYATSTGELMKEAHTQAARLGVISPDGSNHNDSVDAFRHAYASARLAQTYGVDAPRKFGIKHEQDVPNDWHETVMDLHNNQVGRKYGSQNGLASPEELANVIYEKGIKGNELIQNLSDPRIEQYKDFYLKQLEGNWILSENQQQNSSPTFQETVVADAASISELKQNQDRLNKPLAVNANSKEVVDYAFAALLSDDPVAMEKGLDQVFKTQVAQENMQQANEAVIAYDNQQSQIQQIESPARAVRV